MSTEPQGNFGQWFMNRAAEKRMTGAEAARRMGVKQSTISRWSSEGNVPSLKTMRLVAQALGISILEVLAAGGYITPEEAHIEPDIEGLVWVPSDDLIAELARRLRERES